MTTTALATRPSELMLAGPLGSLDHYIQAANAIPVLSASEELELAKRFRETNDLDAARRLVTERTAGILLEPIQSMGGMTTATAEYLQGLREICDRTGALLAFDEIQTGVGRTGSWWYGSHPSTRVRPDRITSAKGLGSGVPVAAVIARDEVAAKVKEGDQGTTFGGGPLACAAEEA